MPTIEVGVEYAGNLSIDSGLLRRAGQNCLALEMPDDAVSTFSLFVSKFGNQKNIF